MLSEETNSTMKKKIGLKYKNGKHIPSKYYSREEAPILSDEVDFWTRNISRKKNIL